MPRGARSLRSTESCIAASSTTTSPVTIRVGHASRSGSCCWRAPCGTRSRKGTGSSISSAGAKATRRNGRAASAGPSRCASGAAHAAAPLVPRSALAYSRGRRLSPSFHRVVGDFAQEAKRSLQTLNIEQKTFRRHLEVLQESHDVVSLDDALSVLDGTRQAARDVAVLTFDDGYRDVYRHAFPVMRDLRVPGVVYGPSAFVGTDRRLGHDRLFAALRQMEARGIGPMAVGVGNPGERWLIDAFEGNAGTQHVLERLIARHPTPGLLRLADALEDRLGPSSLRAPEGELP